MPAPRAQLMTSPAMPKTSVRTEQIRLTAVARRGTSCVRRQLGMRGAAADAGRKVLIVLIGLAVGAAYVPADALTYRAKVSNIRL